VPYRKKQCRLGRAK